MNIRLGSVIISANMIFLLLAGIFFAVITLRNIYPNVAESLSRAILALLLACLGGFAGGSLYVLPEMRLYQKAAGLPSSIINLHFGSFGGYWGALLAVYSFGLITGPVALKWCDGLVPGLLVGGCIARMGDFFTKSSIGIRLNVPQARWFQPFRAWAIFDIAALITIFGFLERGRKRVQPVGYKTLWFLLGYGCVRFLLEFARDTTRYLHWISIGQIAGMFQIALGMILLVKMRVKS